MALIGSTLVLYAVVGLCVVVAVYVSERASRSPGLWFRLATALPFWPLYLPILLAHSQVVSGAGERPGSAAPAPFDDMSAAIARVDAELEAALNSLDGWAEQVLAREKDRIRELRDAWTAQAGGIRELDHLFASGIHQLALGLQNSTDERQSLVATNSPNPLPTPGLGHHNEPSPIKDRLALSQKACQQNFERLRRIRQRAFDDLMGSLAWVRELVSMIHLAKFTGAPASRAEELVAQIAAAVEGLSELTWREESSSPNSESISAADLRPKCGAGPASEANAVR